MPFEIENRFLQQPIQAAAQQNFRTPRAAQAKKQRQASSSLTKSCCEKLAECCKALSQPVQPTPSSPLREREVSETVPLGTRRYVIDENVFYIEGSGDSY